MSSFAPGLKTAPSFLEDFMGDRYTKRCLTEANDFGQDVDNSTNDVPLQNMYNNGLTLTMRGYERDALPLEGNYVNFDNRPEVNIDQAVSRFPGSAPERLRGAYPGGVGFATNPQATAGTFLGAPTAHGGLPGNANLGRTGAIPSITQQNRPGATGYIPTVEQGVRTAGASPMPQGLAMSDLGQPDDEQILASLRRRGIRR